MTVYAAIDLLGGRAVQLVGGRPETERASRADPVATARAWVEAGFRALHVVDLDAALGTGSNRATIEAILAAVPVPVQVGGGIRDDDRAAALLAAGAARIVTGTRAVEDPDWLAALAARFPGRVVAAADIRAGRIATRGWTADSGLAPADFLARLDPLPLAGVLVTDIDREGRMEGVDAELFGALRRATRHPLLAAGGIARTADLEALARQGVAGAVLGMALYTGTLDPRAAAAAGDGTQETAR